MMQRKAPIVVVLGTGGTIAGLASSPTEHLAYAAAQLGVEALVARAEARAGGVQVETEQVAQLDSKDMDVATWRRLAERVTHHLARPDVAGVVITHGTDTLEETAYFLSRVVDAAKPVVLTAAMRPASSNEADGPRNLADAIAVAASAEARAEPPWAVVAVVAGEIHAAHDVRKVHPQRLAAFSSGERGPIGGIDHGVVRRDRSASDGEAPIGVGALPLEGTAWPWVEIVTSVAGADGRSVDALLGAGVDGIVVAATGNGTLHRALDGPLARAQARGVALLRSTRCLDGAIVDVAAAPSAIADGKADGCVLPSAGDLTPVKARIALIVALLTAPLTDRTPDRKPTSGAAVPR